MALSDTDKFLVDRSGTNYNVQAQSLMAKVEDTDLLLVDREGTNYKLTGQELKDSLGGGGSGGIFPSENDLTINPSVPGSGTQADPYILATRTAAPAGSTVFTSETITFTEQPPNTDVIWTDNSTGSGTRFSQPVTKTDANGTWSAELQYADAPDSTEDTDYIGDLQIGTLHFQWRVNQSLSDRIPTEVVSVNLVDTGLDDGPRFTDQNFVFTSIVTDGVPLPTKTIEAHVDGSLRVTPETSEIIGESTVTVPGGWTSQVVGDPAATYRAAAYGNGIFLTVGTSTHYAYSATGTSGWTTGDLSDTAEMSAIAFGNGVFSAVGGDGQRWSTTDGTSWNSGTEGSLNFYGIAFGDSKFVVVGASGALRVSPSGTANFTLKTTPTTDNLRGVVYSSEQNLWVAVGDSGVCISSPDTETWTLKTTLSTSFKDVAYGSGKFVAVGGSGKIIYSTDGLNWPAANESTVGTKTWNAVKYLGGKFIATGSSGFNATSTDGVNWTLGTAIDPAFTYYDIAHDGSLYLTVAGEATVATSASGQDTYEAQTLTLANDAGLSNFAVGDAVVQDSGFGPTTTPGSGTVRSINSSTMSIAGSEGTWTPNEGKYVVGPEKIIANSRQYLKFDSSGNVTDMQSRPQDPPYTTTATNPNLTLTFPSTFPSGETPDDELPEGTTLSVGIASENLTNRSPLTGYEEAIVQPVSSVTVSDMFATTLYSGTDSNQTITNGIDLAGKGGLVWTKARSEAYSHALYDTLRGPQNVLQSQTTTGQQTFAGNGLSSFNVNGFDLGNQSWSNSSATDYVAWTFRKAPKFFDIQTWSGNSVAGREIPHNLNSDVGMLIVKSLSSSAYWTCWHKSTGNARLFLNDNSAKVAGAESFFGNGSNYIPPTSTDFTVSSDPDLNGTGEDYVAYLFADTPGLIKCGTYSGNATIGHKITTGFKPQWIMIKLSEDTGGATMGWVIVDAARGLNSTSDIPRLFADMNSAETGIRIGVDDDGFILGEAGGSVNRATAEYIYVAIAAPVVDTMTAEQFTEAQLKFATFENRSMVKCGNDAEAKRDDLMLQLEEDGYSLPDILKYL
jgi:hypothetical protein